ncbi:MAG TPA: isoaspartyl peptidase/L-asparaginase [Pseudonocardiaceae bacterium]
MRDRSTSTDWRATAPVLAVHGGAGRIVAEELGAQRAAAARHGLAESLAAGMAVLPAGGSALAAVVLAARAVLERTPHVLMSGTGAQVLGRREGLSFAPAAWS